jgi:prepilin-type N-terminal cleavage/methylation domain-containing protein
VKTQPSHHHSSGFTLIELVISAALATMILVSAYMCLSSAITSQKLIEPRVDVLQSARVAMAIMSADLRSACPLSKDFQFLGMHRMLGDVEADNLDFATHNYTPRRPGEGDYCQISFYLDMDPRSGKYVLWRRRNPAIALDPLSGGTREEIARGVRGVRFEYYDGFDWYDTWGEIPGQGKPKSPSRDQFNLSGMPEAVRITLLFDAKPGSKAVTALEQERPEPPLIFRTVARLNLAATSSQSSSGSGTSDSSGPTPSGARGGGVN